MALTNLATVKSMLGVTSTSEDARYSSLIAAADRLVKSYCKRDFESQTYTHFYSGSNTYRLPLRQRPVTAVASVYLDQGGFFGKGDSAFDSTTLLDDGVDYVLDWDSGSTQSHSGILFRVGGVWPSYDRFYSPLVYARPMSIERGPGLGNIKVTYTAGYTSIPDDLQFAVAELTAWMYRNAPYGGIPLHSEKIGDYAYELARRKLEDFELGTVKSILASYREFGW